MVLVQGEDKAWHRTMTVWLSIPYVVADRGRHMGALAPAAFVPSHTNAMDRMFIPVAAMLTPVHRPMLTPEAYSPWSVLWSSDGFVATGAGIDIDHCLQPGGTHSDRSRCHSDWTR